MSDSDGQIFRGHDGWDWLQQAPPCCPPPNPPCGLSTEGPVVEADNGNIIVSSGDLTKTTKPLACKNGAEKRAVKLLLCCTFYWTSGAPVMFRTIVEEILSGASAGTETVMPSAAETALSFSPVASSSADCTLFFNPGTSNLPSAGQFQTCR